MDRLEPLILKTALRLGLTEDYVRYCMHQGIKRKSLLILDNIGIRASELSKGLGYHISEAPESRIIDVILEMDAI